MLTIITPSIRPKFLELTQQTLESQTDQNFEWLVEVGLRNRGFGLPIDYNKMLRRAKGDVIFILQDCIALPIDAVEKVALLNFEKRAYTFPVGKIANEDGKEGLRWDWRKFRETALGKAEITPNQWEADLAAAPLSMFQDVGGFDEDFCNGWSFDNVEIAWRAEAAGYKFFCSQAAEGIAIDHDKLVKHPWRETLPLNAARANATMERARRGDFKLNYL